METKVAKPKKVLTAAEKKKRAEKRAIKKEKAPREKKVLTPEQKAKKAKKARKAKVAKEGSKKEVKKTVKRKTGEKKVRAKAKRTEGITTSFARRMLIRGAGDKEMGTSKDAVTFAIDYVEAKIKDIVEKAVIMMEFSKRRTITAKLIHASMNPCLISLRRVVATAEPRKNLSKKERKYMLASTVAKRLIKVEAGIRISSSGKTAIAALTGHMLEHLGECAARYTKVSKRSRISHVDITTAAHAYEMKH
jgi:histone H3/H4